MINGTTAYLYVSAAFGLAQVADSVALYRRAGRPGRFATVFSISEYVWAGVSYYVWKLAEASFPFWLPAAFIAYVVAFFAAGILVTVFQGGRLDVVPRHLVAAGGVFGVLYFFSSMFYAIGA